MIRSFNSVENFSARWRMRTTATPSLILGPPHISGSDWERKLKLGMWIDMDRSFNKDENFLR